MPDEYVVKLFDKRFVKAYMILCLRNNNNSELVITIKYYINAFFDKYEQFGCVGGMVGDSSLIII
jgi:hypothetical protein